MRMSPVRKGAVRAHTRWFVAGAVLAVLALGVHAGWAQRSAEEAILPLAEYRAQDVRALAQTYLGELQALYQSVRRCTPEVDFHQYGLGFRRPLGIDGLPPYLATWVWIPSEPALPGDGIGARAAEAFRRYAPKLLPQLVARDVIYADSRVGGYGLILTWIKPPGGDPPIGETLVVFLPKRPVTSFVSGSGTFSELLSTARIRTFDGQTEVKLGSLPIPDKEVPAPPPPC
jgi:hypothetical protein